ncbi:Na/Pi cotransporter family protein [Roseomonas sp. JC162]|uniref:Na/Pi cotransporter family protein n=1 Tax=Neoroseomonas marina TaxID=1232220 RepID=A0A848EBE8_9PROT|nr:Na/Pi cotransporter family protein [Neoroseomonas marina]NMJ40618.1 Na/Pi cotransporter family protein [Neoroseomonas marina]
MQATQMLAQLLGSVALILWGVRMIRTGVTRAYGAELRRVVGAAARTRLGAFFGGVGATALLQSSTATALIIGAFAGKGLIALPAALAVMLGANVGTTLAAQLLAFDVKWLWTVCVAAGVFLFLGTQQERWRGLGRAIVGLGLLLLALDQIGQVSGALRGSETVRTVMAAMGGEPIVAVLVAAALTYAAHASLSIVLLVMSLSGAGILAAPTALALVLGANLGGALVPWIALSGSSVSSRRVQLGNLITRAAGVLAVLPFVNEVAGFAQVLAGDHAERLVVHMHTGFNVALAIVGLPLVGLLARLLERIQRDVPETRDTVTPRHLDDSALEEPAEALACAMRETLHMGDRVADMLHRALPAIEGSELRLVREVEDADNAVDRLYEAIKLYLVQVSRSELTAEESRRYVEILTFTTNLEHIGDIIDKNLMELATKKIRNQLAFSSEGLDEIRAFHTRVEETMRLACNVFATRDVVLARRLFADKGPTRTAEREAAERHFARLKEGRPESIATSAIHLDIIRDLKRIHGHLTAVAYPILEGSGELAESRLRASEEAPARLSPLSRGG